ncbi:MAG: TonB family protein [Betaproteobacteria bacterium]
MQASTPFIPSFNRRLVIGLAISLAVHSLAVLTISPHERPAYRLPTPFQVELARESSSSAGEVATASPAEVPAEVASVAPSSEQKPVHEPTPANPPPEQNAVASAPSSLLQLDWPLDKYYTARELDVRAEQMNEVDLVYPKRAYENRTKGKVVLRLYINEHGGIDNVNMLESAPPGIFEEAALTATLALQFKPAIKARRNVKSIKTIEIVFNPYESINIP